MRTIATLLLGAALIGAAVPAAADSPANARGEAKLAKMLDGRVAGKPVNCVDLDRIQSTEIVDRTAIVYRGFGGKIYVNRPRMGASTLNNWDLPVTRTYGNQLCSLDTVQLYDRTSRIQSGFVGLGQFVPYTKQVAAR